LEYTLIKLGDELDEEAEENGYDRDLYDEHYNGSNESQKHKVNIEN
jgi:hypothetical protein